MPHTPRHSFLVYKQLFSCTYEHNVTSDWMTARIYESVSCDILLQGCHGQGKISGKRNFFQVREKSGIFQNGQGNLETTWKVGEKSGNLKINGYGRQSSENLFILFKRGKDVHSHEIV